jgi:hypothetical protein
MYSAHHELGLPVVGLRSCAAILISCSINLYATRGFHLCPSVALTLSCGCYPPKSEILIHRDFPLQRHSKLFKAVQSHSRIFRNIFYFYAPITVAVRQGQNQKISFTRVAVRKDRLCVRPQNQPKMIEIKPN